MKIGIVSDLHGYFNEALPEALRGCAYILCAGDVEREDIVWQLQTIAPVACVRGNNDWRVDAPITSSITLGGVKFFMVHIRTGALDVPEGTQVVVFGHTHRPCDETIGGVRYLNPGSPTYPRGGSGPSCMVAEVSDGALASVELVPLA